MKTISCPTCGVSNIPWDTRRCPNCGTGLAEYQVLKLTEELAEDREERINNYFKEFQPNMEKEFEKITPHKPSILPILKKYFFGEEAFLTWVIIAIFAVSLHFAKKPDSVIAPIIVVFSIIGILLLAIVFCSEYNSKYDEYKKSKDKTPEEYEEEKNKVILRYRAYAEKQAKRDEEEIIREYEIKLGVSPSVPYSSFNSASTKPAFRQTKKEDIDEYVPKCPICGSTDLTQISTVKKAAKVATFGIYGAGDIGKTWRCNNCKSKF
ncbi:putative uncharacterized protein [Ruminococcus sp. CAG:579]|nr:putative uncharacterized protein [Ruminococcus sp. CAG:579]